MLVLRSDYTRSREKREPDVSNMSHACRRRSATKLKPKLTLDTAVTCGPENRIAWGNRGEALILKLASKHPRTGLPVHIRHSIQKAHDRPIEAGVLWPARPMWRRVHRPRVPSASRRSRPRPSSAARPGADTQRSALSALACGPRGMTRPLDHARASALNSTQDPQPGQDCGQLTERGSRAYGAAHGHMTARYWSRHATWKVTCALSGKVTVTASPGTGCAHHVQGRTGSVCRDPGRMAFPRCLPFLRSMSVTPPKGCQLMVPCSRVRTLLTRQRPRMPGSQPWAV